MRQKSPCTTKFGAETRAEHKRLFRASTTTTKQCKRHKCMSHWLKLKKCRLSFSRPRCAGLSAESPPEAHGCDPTKDLSIRFLATSSIKQSPSSKSLLLCAIESISCQCNFSVDRSFSKNAYTLPDYLPDCFRARGAASGSGRRPRCRRDASPWHCRHSRGAALRTTTRAPPAAHAALRASALAAAAGAPRPPAPPPPAPGPSAGSSSRHPHRSDPEHSPTQSRRKYILIAERTRSAPSSAVMLFLDDGFTQAALSAKHVDAMGE